jgi:hypothetical protein
VGRPDIPRGEDFGLIDVNRASPDALCRLPGVTQEIARRITEIRQGVGFFKSADELGIYLDLSPAVVDEMSEYSVFSERAYTRPATALRAMPLSGRRQSCSEQSIPASHRRENRPPYR